MAKWCAIGIDETRYYNIAPEDAPHIDKIVSVYFYDAEEGTYLCEMTPSYHLRHLYTTIFYKDYEKSEDVVDELDMKYCYEGNEDIYLHCSDVREYAKAHPDLHTEWGAVSSEEGEPEEEEVREYWQGNCPF